MESRTKPPSESEASGDAAAPKRRKRSFAVIAVVLGVLLALGSAEIMLRVYVASRGWTANCYVTELAFFVPHESAGYALRPGLRLKSSAYDVSVNSCGLRGSELNQTHAAEEKRIVVVGGSSVFGYLAPDGQDSCTSLQQQLSDLNRNVEVLNAGVPGYTIAQCKGRFVADLASLQPDYVLLYLGWNNIPQLIGKPQPQPAAPSWFERVLASSVLYGFLRHRLFPIQRPKFAPPTSMQMTAQGQQEFRRDLGDLLDAVKQSGAEPVIASQLTASGNDCSELDSFLGSSETQVKQNREIGQWIVAELKSTATSRQLAFIDCSTPLPCSRELLGDAVHLTPQGHREVAKIWANAFIEILESSGPETH